MTYVPSSNSEIYVSDEIEKNASSISISPNGENEKSDSKSPDRQLPKDIVNIRDYVCIPATIGAVGSVALSFKSRDQKSVFFTEESIVDEEPVQHNFIDSVVFPAWIELILFLLSSVLLGIITGTVGTLLSIGAPEENNKARVAASALMFSLFFPSFLTMMESNATSQAQVINLEQQVQEVQEKAKASEIVATGTVREAVARVNGIDQSITEIEGEVQRGEVLEPVRNQILQSRKALIDEAKSLAVNSITPENSIANINKIVEVASSDGTSSEIIAYAIEALETIQNNPELSQGIRTHAEKGVEQISPRQ